LAEQNEHMSTGEHRKVGAAVGTAVGSAVVGVAVGAGEGTAEGTGEGAGELVSGGRDKRSGKHTC
jgi:hypothetical protein